MEIVPGVEKSSDKGTTKIGKIVCLSKVLRIGGHYIALKAAILSFLPNFYLTN